MGPCQYTQHRYDAFLEVHFTRKICTSNFCSAVGCKGIYPDWKCVVVWRASPLFCQSAKTGGTPFGYDCGSEGLKGIDLPASITLGCKAYLGVSSFKGPPVLTTFFGGPPRKKVTSIYSLRAIMKTQSRVWRWSLLFWLLSPPAVAVHPGRPRLRGLPALCGGEAAGRRSLAAAAGEERGGAGRIPAGPMGESGGGGVSGWGSNIPANGPQNGLAMGEAANWTHGVGLGGVRTRVAVA